MDTITKAILFGGKAIVSIVDAKDIAIKAQALHAPSVGAMEALGRTLAITSFMSAGMKGAKLTMSVTIDGEGSLGKIVCSGVSGGIVRGYVEHSQAELPRLPNGNSDMISGIGKGTMLVCKDFGLKDPYVGNCQLLRGDIDSDFAYYFTTSEQLPSAVASGCKIEDGVIKSCGAIIVQPMPNCEEHILVVLQDIVRNFQDFGSLIASKSADEIINFYFGHFECKVLDKVTPRYECQCSRERMDGIVKSLGKAEALDIIKENGQIEIHCEFCNTYYRYDVSMVDKLFRRTASGENNTIR